MELPFFLELEKKTFLNTVLQCLILEVVFHKLWFNYLRQGGYVFASFCLSVCLFVCVSER